MLKKVLIGLAVLVTVIAVAAYYVVSNIDTIAKDVIEESGSKVLGTEVTVGSVEVKLGAGKATIRKLTVANPPGYSADPAFSFTEVAAAIEIQSGTVTSIYTSQPEIRVEFIDGKSNFDVLNRNIKAWEQHNRSADKDELTGEKERDKKPRSVQIDEVVVEKAKATVVSDQREEPIELTIDRLQFRNLEGSPEQIARVVLGQFVAQVLAETTVKMLQQRAVDMLEGQSDELKEKLKSLLQ